MLLPDKTKRTSLLFFLLSFILFVLTRFIAGSYYETNDDFAMDYSIRGLMGLPVSNFYICLNGISEVFALLYKFIPGFPVYPAVLYFFLLISVISIFSLLDKGMPGLSFRKKSGLMILFYYFFLLENVMYFNFTRVAILLCASSLLQIYFQLLHKSGYARVFIYAALLFIGTLIRGEAFYLSCLMVLPGILLMEYYRDGKPSKAFFQLLFAGFFLGIAFHVLKYFMDEPAVTAYINLTTYVTDYHVIDKSKIIAAKDQLYYEGIYQWFFADGNIFSFIRFKTFVDQKSYGLFYFNINKIIFSLSELSYTLIHNYFVFLCLNAGLIFYFIFSEAAKKYLLILLNIYIWLLLILIVILLKVEDRVLSPALVAYTMLNVMIVFKHPVKFPFKKSVITIAVLLLILYSVKVIHRAQFSSERKEQNTMALQQIREVSAKNQYIVATIIGRYFTFLDPFKNYNCGLENKLIRLSGWLSVFPENHAMIKKAADKDSLEDLFRYCADNKIPFIAQEDELDFMKRYFKAFYNKDLRFEHGEIKNEILRIYYLKE
jgi:hypothetical protein